MRGNSEIMGSSLFPLIQAGATAGGIGYPAGGEGADGNLKTSN